MRPRTRSSTRWWQVRRRRGRWVVTAFLVAGLTAACGTPGASAHPTPPATTAVGATATQAGVLPTSGGLDAADLARKYPGLKPLGPAPAPPAVKPVNTDGALPPVINHIPTDQKIVFVTIDDGAEKDPAFIQLVRDLHVPVTLFLTDAIISNNYGYFGRLQAAGASIQDHTLTHPNFNVISPDRQRHEICGQADKLGQEYGTRPYLLRPPYGNYTAQTAPIAKSCGIRAIVLWRETMQKQDMQYQTADHHLQPGDIILCHFRGPDTNGKSWPTMVTSMVDLFEHIEEQGYTVASLEDYV